ncbi:hypothetical protein [Terriglobus tenax]|uniref:hypothetical protein n=1 Tax=Terriglobus tenax TaxID=1111115 RepID=UPI0021E07CE5|nr:hypothetical protein [Terriglobus tenax]
MTADELILQGKTARLENRLLEAAEYYREAANLQHDQPLRYAHTIRHAGDILRLARRFDAAEPCLVEALAIYRSHPERDTLDLANAIRGYACLADDLQRRELSAELWAEARELYRLCGIDAGVQEAKQRLGLLG